MAYTIVDLLDKIIHIAQNKKNIYSDYLKKTKENSNDYLLIKVLNKNIDKSIEYYKKLKNEVHEINTEEIDFVIYDKISFLINEFESRNTYEEFKEINKKEINKIEDSYLNFQKEVLALYLSIVGRLVKNQKATETDAYETLCYIIKYKERNIIEIEEFIKKYS